MWWVRTKSDGEEGGGFQNRDVGKSLFDKDFGPDYGVDYARFSDPPNFAKDEHLKRDILSELKNYFPELVNKLDIKVRNGFVIVSGEIVSKDERDSILRRIDSCYGVKEVISQFQFH